MLARAVSNHEIEEYFRQISRENGEFASEIVADDGERTSCRLCGRYFIPTYGKRDRVCWHCEGK